MKTNAKKTKKAIQTILAVLKEAGLTQRDFANMIGVPVDTVKSWTRSKPLQVSPAFKLAIRLSTGAVIQPNGSVDSFSMLPFIKLGLFERPATFSTRDFDSWRNKLCPSTESVANRASDIAALLIRELFTEAVKPERGKRLKLPGVLDSFNRWFIGTVTDFNISAIVEKSRVVDPRSMTADQFRMFLFSAEMGTPLDELDALEGAPAMEEEIAKVREKALKENPLRKEFLNMLDEMLTKLRKAKKPLPNPAVSMSGSEMTNDAIQFPG
jgi:hypothetical protein